MDSASSDLLPSASTSERFTHKLLHPDRVSDLFAEHKDKVAQVLERARRYVQQHPELEAAAKQVTLDELYALRFLLSTKSDDVNQAAENLEATLRWRSERLENLENARKGRIVYNDLLTKHSHVAIVGLLGGLHPTVVVRAGRANMKGIFNELTQDQLVENQLMFNEAIFHQCDLKTRETGLLCKQIAIIDIEGFSLFRFDPKFGKMMGKASTLSAVFYPQLLGKTIIMNMPLTFRVIFKAMRVFMPASTLEKQAMCPANTLKKSASECPFLKKFANGPEIMPPFLGGTRAMLPELQLDGH